MTEKELLREEKVAIKWKLMLEIKEKYETGTGIRQLSREYSISRNTIRGYIKAEKPIYYQTTKKRGSKLDKFRDLIVKLSSEDKTHEEILTFLKELGYDGSRSNISVYMSKNNIKKSTTKTINTSKNRITNLKENSLKLGYVVNCICKNKLSDCESNDLKKIKDKFPEILKFKSLIDDFKNMFKTKENSLESWLKQAKAFDISELNTFTNGLERDFSAVENSITSTFTNGLLEGMVNKVKRIKCISYGRCSFELLKLKVLNSQQIYG